MRSVLLCILYKRFSVVRWIMINCLDEVSESSGTSHEGSKGLGGAGGTSVLRIAGGGSRRNVSSG